MYKESNTAIRNAIVQMQAAVDGGEKEQITAAMEKFGEAIAATVQADYESAHGDQQILLQRGFRVLTSEEKKYYEKLIEAGKKATVQEMNGLLTPEVMPNTIIEDVYRNLVNEHPLLSRINFQSVKYLTRWILNDHSAQTAVWGPVNAQISQQITSAFQTIEITQCKLSAYAMIEMDMLEMGPVFLDAYIRAFMSEALAAALERAIICGNGHNAPIGLDRDIHRGVTVNSSTGYPQKTPIELASFTPKDYGTVLAGLAVSEVWYTEDSSGDVVAATTALSSGVLQSGYTKHGGANRVFDEVMLICNQVDFLTKIMPATTVINAEGRYIGNVFPFPTEVIRSAEMETGKALLVLPKEYFFGLGTSKNGTLTYSDEFKFLEDKRVYKIKMHGMGRAYDDTVAILLDISDLESAYIWTKDINVDVDVEDPDGTGSGSGVA